MPRKKLDAKPSTKPIIKSEENLKKKLADNSDDDMGDEDPFTGSGDDSETSSLSDSQSGGSDKEDFESDIEDNSINSDNEDDEGNLVCAARYADHGDHGDQGDREEGDDDDDSLLNDQDLEDVDSKILEELDIKLKLNNKIIPKEKRITKPFMTKYERVRLICDRARQLADGAKPLIKDVEGLSSRKIANLELENNIIPIIIERPLPNGYKEIWKVSELKH